MTGTIPMHRFLIGFAEGVIVAAAVFGALVNYASAEPCFPSKQAIRAVHPTEWISYTTRYGGQRWYLGHPKRVKCDESDSPVGAQLRQGFAERKAANTDARRVTKEAGGPTRPSSASALPLAPTKVKTVAATSALVETTGVAAAGSMSSPWTEDFYPLLQGREEHAQFIPAVLTITETRIAEKRPETTVISLREPSNLRSEFRRDMLHLLAGVLAILTVIGLGTFLVGEIQRLLRTREARR